jgi:hypothetical protein
VKAIEIKAALELGRRVYMRKSKGGIKWRKKLIHFGY